MTNRQIAEIIFEALKEEKFTPIDIEYRSGYFIFETGDDSVVHFHIKQIKGWRFAMWIDTESEAETVQFFAQFEELIDKFKPSRSFFCESVSKNDLEAETKEFFSLIKMVKHIKCNPRLALVQDMGWYSPYIDRPLWREYLSCLRCLYKHRMRKVREYLIDDKYVHFVNSISAKIVRKWKDEVLNDVKVIDQNKGAFVFYPRWDVVFVYNRISDDDLAQAIAMNRLIVKVNKYRILFTKINTSFTDVVIKKEGGYERW